MTAIRSLRANVTREEALRHFTGGTLPIASWFRSPVQSIAELYIPFRLFKVKFVNGGREESHIFGLDAVHGVMDLYEFSGPPGAQEVTSLESRNVLPVALGSLEARERVLAKVRKLVFSRGFFRMRDVRFEAEQIPGEICVPYWVCFRGKDKQLRLAVMDAVRRRAEGAKVRRMIEDWLQCK
ncbi:MAG TPA: hypothetical protein VLT90_11260 [Terriglobales bacterium]|nr:hypothetical protein [Terriglobales bacterium]